MSAKTVLATLSGGREWEWANAHDAARDKLTACVGKTVVSTHDFEHTERRTYGDTFDVAAVLFSDGSGIACVIASDGFPGTHMTPGGGTSVEWYILAAETR